MSNLQRFLRACFANAALIYLMASISAVPVLISLPLPSTNTRFEQESLALKALAVILLVASRLILAIPMVLTAVFGMAWWQLKTGKPAARRWAMAASIVMLLSALPLLPATYEMFHNPRFPSGIATTCAILILASLAIGIAGIVAFSKRHAGAGMGTASAPSRIAGDGTHKTLDAIALILQIGGTLALVNLYTRWGYEHDLPLTQGLNSWIQWAVVILGVTFIHESAHALVGLAVGMKLRAFVIGPFQWRVVESRWTFEFRPTQMLAFSGAAGLPPTAPDQSRWNEVAMIAAGPFVNLLAGVVAAALAYSAEDYAWWRYWEFFALFATVSLVAGIVNLIPLQPNGLYSDGARIVQLFRHSPAADFTRVVKCVSSTVVSPRRPRDYDLAAMERASTHFSIGEQALLLRVWRCSCLLDRGELVLASEALAEAELVYRESATDISPDLHTGFIIKGIALGRDRAYIREWWASMEAKKPKTFNQDYWLAKSAFHWAENNIPAALEAWNTGQAYLEKLPDFGTYNYDRDRFACVKDILASPTVEIRADANKAPAAQTPFIEVLPAPVFE